MHDKRAPYRLAIGEADLCCHVYKTVPIKVPCIIATLLVLHFLDLLDPRDVGDLALEAGLHLPAGQGEDQQKEDNLLLGIQMGK